MSALDELNEIAANDAALRREFKKLIEDLRAEIERLRAERDMWQARATAMFWTMDGNVTAGELRAKTAQALAAIRNER